MVEKWTTHKKMQAIASWNLTSSESEWTDPTVYKKNHPKWQKFQERAYNTNFSGIR